MVMRMINAIRHIAYFCSPTCQMWYQRVIESNATQSASRTVQDTQLSTSSSRKQQWVDDKQLDDSPAQFRRVRLKCVRHDLIIRTPPDRGNDWVSELTFTEVEAVIGWQDRKTWHSGKESVLIPLTCPTEKSA